MMQVLALCFFSHVLCLFSCEKTVWGVYMSKLTDPDLKSIRMLNLGNGCNFQWYFSGPRAFGGILRKSRSFSAMRPIFPLLKNNLLFREAVIISQKT